MNIEEKNNFDRLETAQKQFEFWTRTLKKSYIDFLFNFDQLEEYHDFQIHPTRNEWKAFNQLILEEVKKSSDHKGKLLDYDLLCKNFIIESKKQGGKLLYANNYLKDVDESFGEYRLGRNSDSFKVNLKYNADYRSFSDYLQYRIKPDYSQITPGRHILRIENGVTLAKFRLYLSEQSSPQTAKDASKDSLSIKQWVLILRYSGVLDTLSGDQTVKANLFAPLLRKNWKDVYDAIRNVNQRQNPSDLRKVQGFFDDNDLKEFSAEVRKDIPK